MVWLQSVLLYLHILGAIFWFGSSLFMQFFMVPALRAMQFEAQKPWMMAISGRYGRVVGPLAGLRFCSGSCEASRPACSATLARRTV